MFSFHYPNSEVRLAFSRYRSIYLLATGIQSSLSKMERYLTSAQERIMEMFEAQSRSKFLSKPVDLIISHKITQLISGCKAKPTDLALRPP
jgi:hypothetical protein